MTTYQSNFNSYVAFKKQSGLGSPESGSGGTIMRLSGGTPGELTKGIIGSKEVRRDAQRTRGRHGFQKTAGGPYDGETSLGSFDDIFQALLRGAWDTELSKTSADFTTIAIASNVLTLASGNPISLGFRVGDVIEMTGGAVAGNNSRNLRITALTATTITVAETLVDHTEDAGITLLRRGRKVIMPPVGSLVDTYFTLEERDEDIDESLLFPDIFWNAGKWSFGGPNNLLMFTPSWIGTGAMTVETAPNSPVLTSPSTPTGAPYAVADATIRYGSTDLVDLTSFDLSIDMGAVAPETVNPNKISPTVLPGQNSCTMNLTMLLSDFAEISNFLNETSLSLHVLAVDNSSDPKNFLSLNVPFFTLGGAKRSPISTAGGAKTQTLSIPPDLIGQDTAGSGYDATMMSIQISNNS